MPTVQFLLKANVEKKLRNVKDPNENINNHIRKTNVLAICIDTDGSKIIGVLLFAFYK